MCNRTQNDAIWGLIALFLTNQIAGNTNDFKNIKQITYDTSSIKHVDGSHFDSHKPFSDFARKYYGFGEIFFTLDNATVLQLYVSPF